MRQVQRQTTPYKLPFSRLEGIELERVCSQTQLCQLRCLMTILDNYMFRSLLAIFRLSLRELKVLLCVCVCVYIYIAGPYVLLNIYIYIVAP